MFSRRIDRASLTSPGFVSLHRLFLPVASCHLRCPPQQNMSDFCTHVEWNNDDHFAPLCLTGLHRYAQSPTATSAEGHPRFFI